MAVEGVTITSERRAAMRTMGALTRVSAFSDGCSRPTLVGKEVQRVPQDVSSAHCPG